ncbi:MAG: permease-like cell division protein FtsX [Elusimicrobia bacterium]|nr:permease-like cell division protein FtsX [Elusimicrobiota bacterium]
MKHPFPYLRFVPVIAVVTPVLVLVCLTLNLRYQAKQQARALLATATVAVFLNADASAAAVMAPLSVDALVAQTDFISKEAVLEKMAQAGSPLKEILATGENPFTPYFLVHLKAATAPGAKAVAEHALKIAGVQDVRYDEKIFLAADRLAALYRLSQAGLLLVFVVFSLVAAFRLFNITDHQKFDYALLGMTLLSGIVSVLLAGGAYMLLVRWCGAVPVGVLPLTYVLTLFPAGLLLSVVAGLKR